MLGGSWSLIALSLWHYYFGRCVDWFPPTPTLCCGNTDCGDTHAAKSLQLDGDAWPLQLCVFFFFRGWFLSVLFLKFLLKTRDPGFSRFFHRLGMKTLIFRLGMPPEWRHGYDWNTWELWDITQGDLKHYLQYAGQSHCLGSRHVIIRTSGFYDRNPLGIIPKHQLNRCGFVGDKNMLGCFGWWICVSPPPQPTKQCFFFLFAKPVFETDCNRGCLVVPALWAAIQCFWISFQPMLLLIWFYTHRLSGRPWTMRIWSWRSVRRQPIHWNLSIEKRMDFMTCFLFQQVTSSSFTVKLGFLDHILSNNNKKTIEIETWTKIS